MKISIDMVRLDINFAFKNRMWSPFMFFFFVSSDMLCKPENGMEGQLGNASDRVENI